MKINGIDVSSPLPGHGYTTDRRAASAWLVAAVNEIPKDRERRAGKLFIDCFTPVGNIPARGVYHGGRVVFSFDFKTAFEAFRKAVGRFSRDDWAGSMATIAQTARVLFEICDGKRVAAVTARRGREETPMLRAIRLRRMRADAVFFLIVHKMAREPMASAEEAQKAHGIIAAYARPIAGEDGCRAHEHPSCPVLTPFNAVTIRMAERMEVRLASVNYRFRTEGAGKRVFKASKLHTSITGLTVAYGERIVRLKGGGMLPGVRRRRTEYLCLADLSRLSRPNRDGVIEWPWANEFWSAVMAEKDARDDMRRREGYEARVKDYVARRVPFTVDADGKPSTRKAAAFMGLPLSVEYANSNTKMHVKARQDHDCIFFGKAAIKEGELYSSFCVRLDDHGREGERFAMRISAQGMLMLLDGATPEFDPAYFDDQLNGREDRKQDKETGDKAALTQKKAATVRRQKTNSAGVPLVAKKRAGRPKMLPKRLR